MKTCKIQSLCTLINDQDQATKTFCINSICNAIIFQTMYDLNVQKSWKQQFDSTNSVIIRFILYLFMNDSNSMIFYKN